MYIKKDVKSRLVAGTLGQSVNAIGFALDGLVVVLGRNGLPIIVKSCMIKEKNMVGSHF